MFSFSQVDSLKRTIKKFFGDNPIESKIIARIVNRHHFERLCNLLKEPRVQASIVHGGSVDEEKLYILVLPYHPSLHTTEKQKENI